MLKFSKESVQYLTSMIAQILHVSGAGVSLSPNTGGSMKIQELAREQSEHENTDMT